jgi:hypothetical protein
MPVRNLINICVFHNKQYIDLLNLLLQTLYFNGEGGQPTFDILIMTAPEYKADIEELISLYKFKCSVDYMIRPFKSMLEAAAARLYLFEYEHIGQYDRILYIDTDVLINNDLNFIFELPIDSGKLYVLKEGHLELDFYGGKRLFDFSKVDPSAPAFTTGILLFKNSDEIRDLFAAILAHIAADAAAGAEPFSCLEQPYVVYNAVMRKAYDNDLLEAYVENNPVQVSPAKYIYHFPGWVGHYTSKIDKMMVFSKKLLQRPAAAAAAAAPINSPATEFIDQIYAVYKRNTYGAHKKEYILLLKFAEDGVVHTSFKNFKGTYYKIGNNKYILKLIKHIMIVLFDDSDCEKGLSLNTPDNDIYFIEKFATTAASITSIF